MVAFNLSAEQILQLAPDSSAARAGKELAARRKWLRLGYNDQAAWGECQGSSSAPYQTQVFLAEPAFRCTCPSRKFPCKHGLGLLLLLESEPRSFEETVEPPAWVRDWLAKKVQKESRPETRPPDKAATLPSKTSDTQARRAGERQLKVEAGLAELELWLRDLVRHGLAAAQTQPNKYWSNIAARMIDAQAPGLARQLSDLAGLADSGTGWQSRLLDRLGRLHLLLQGYKQFDRLPAGLQTEIRAQIGWTANQEELLAQDGLRDRWLVTGQRVYEEDRLRTQRTWLWGIQSGRPALVLNFAHGNQPLDTSLRPGTQLEAEVVFFPGAYPLRALVKQRSSNPPAATTVWPGYPSITTAINEFGQALAANPWLVEFPVALTKVYPVFQADRWIVRDQDGAYLPLRPSFGQGWTLLALGGGRPLALFGEWNGQYLRPLSVWNGDRLVNFKEEE